MDATFELTAAEPEPEANIDNPIVSKLLEHTPSLLPLARTLALAASHHVTALLTGETGTGKTFLARLIHDCSPRRDERFLVVPCGALASNLVESELFGHVKGSFSGAEQNKEGKFAAAGRGTILLDEIDVLGLDQQAKLLRVLESGEYEPVGSNQTLVNRARVIASSNVNLEEAIRQGKFREDLFYRLNVLSFHLPPLRERRQDIAPLVREAIWRFGKKFDKPIRDISAPTLTLLENHSWPGNIRQLENVVQQAVLISSGESLLPKHLPSPVRDQAMFSESATAPDAGSLVHFRQINEADHIQRVLDECNYSRVETAKTLRVSRVTLYKKIKKYRLRTSPHRTGTPASWG